jgi:hypothetical protein
MRDTIDMALEAGFPFNKYGLLQGNDDNEIDADEMFKAFEALVRADERSVEREACAKVCDDWPNGRDDVYSIGVAIRARGKT